MSEIIYKPYEVIAREWDEICNRLRIAQNKFYSTQNPLFTEYPSDNIWNEYLKVQDAYDNAREEFNRYRQTVRISD